MSGIIKTKFKKAICVIAVSMIILTAASITVYAADNPIRLTVRQIYSASSYSPYNTFTYRFIPLSTENPMPEGSAAAGYTFTITGAESVAVGPVDFNHKGIYRYEVYQAVNAPSSGYTYDRRVYTIEIYVDELLNVNVIVLNENGAKEDEIVFENSYNDFTSPPTPPTPGITTNPPINTVHPPGITDGIIDIDPPGVPIGAEDIDLPDTPIGLIEIGDTPDPSRPGIKGPDTGDDSNVNLYITLLILGGSLVIGSAVYLIIGKRRKDRHEKI